ncbi:hypothetical protein WBN73_13935 [Paenarthrobacter sp. CCNWLY172]|uniref:hypothetical protein n=1 Tax=unclassified Paenarthrobacter TaxID=2634190 RepID=UPI0030773B80
MTTNGEFSNHVAGLSGPIVWCAGALGVVCTTSAVCLLVVLAVRTVNVMAARRDLLSERILVAQQEADLAAMRGVMRRVRVQARGHVEARQLRLETRTSKRFVPETKLAANTPRQIKIALWLFAGGIVSLMGAAFVNSAM